MGKKNGKWPDKRSNIHKYRDSGDWERFWHQRKRWLVNRRRLAARKRGMEFTIKASDLVWPEYCPVLGLRIDYKSLGKVRYNSPSLDRIDLRFGYVPGNVAVISQRANTLKSNGTIKEFTAVVEYMAMHYLKRLDGPLARFKKPSLL